MTTGDECENWRWYWCPDCKKHWKLPLRPGEESNFWDAPAYAPCQPCRSAEKRSLGMHPEDKHRGFVP